MIYFSPAKINIGLFVTSKREDGFHNIESIFYPIPFYDVIEIMPSKKYHFDFSGVPQIEGENIIERAYDVIKNDNDIPNCHIHLHKNIPIGAGLGGGSGNGVTALLALNKLFELHISDTKIEEYSLILGSDCPFFIENKPKFVTGRGECLKEIKVNLEGYFLVIINPQIHIGTKEAYQNITIKNNPVDKLSHSILQPMEHWKNTIKNDFEQYAFSKYPEIELIKNKLYDCGAVFSLMTGSGSTVYGLFKEKTKLPVFPSHYFIKWMLLS